MVHSRGTKCPSDASASLPRRKRAQGMSGAWHTRSLVCEGRKHTSSHHRYAETIRHSLRNGFNGLSSCSPRSAGLDSLRRSPIIAASLIPASGDQDHTTSPSALVAFVLRAICVHRIPRPTSVTIARRPLLWSAGRGELVKMICPTGIAKFFCVGDWTTQISLERLKKLVFTRTQLPLILKAD